MGPSTQVIEKSPADLLGSYLTPAGVYNEVFAAPGEIRPHWQKFAASLNGIGRHELAARWEQAKRMLYESGVTYNAYGDPHGIDRPWELDAIPYLVSAAEWSQLSAGLIQRATLLNLILADLYGPQRLLAEGLLPAELIYSHPGFLRPCHGTTVLDDVYLQLYAADLVHASDGSWWIQADRTQNPSGAGYAVENRIIVSRMLPNVFHDCQVERLAPFFVALRETLTGLAPRHRDNPRIVLLSAGPTSNNYFEDAYLSRYLGYTLVEGGDLAVRDHCVYVKTLGGLLRVDVILRRISDEDCDALELRGDSLLGVAGLLQSIRAGEVAVANALGTGLLETPAIMPFLPGLCRHLLDQDLKIASVATWWCGQDPALAYVIENMDRLVIAPAFRRSGITPVFGATLSAREKALWVARIKARPQLFVGRESIACSATPVWDGIAIVPRHLALRSYLVASRGTYVAMPGGLTRMSSTANPVSAGQASDRGSKDAWILSEGPVQPVSLLHPAGQPVELRRTGSELPSRVADNLHWLGRQAERAEGAARLLRSILVRLTSELEPGAMPEMPVLLSALAKLGEISPAAMAATHERLPVVEKELRAFIFDPTRPGSLRRSLTSLHRLASIVRDRISIDTWRILNRVERDFTAPASPDLVQMGDVLAMLNQMVLNLAAFSGLGMESMTRGQGWRFLDMGRRLERPLHMIGLLESALVECLSPTPSVLEAVLEVADSSMTYRSRYLSTLQLAPVLDLLLTDETNPRSVAFQLAALANHVENLPRDVSNPARSPEQRIMLAVLTNVRLAEVHVLCEEQPDQPRRQLGRLLARLADQLPKLSESISHRYLIHAGPSRQLGEIRPEPMP